MSLISAIQPLTFNAAEQVTGSDPDLYRGLQLKRHLLGDKFAYDQLDKVAQLYAVLEPPQPGDLLHIVLFDSQHNLLEAYQGAYPGSNRITFLLDVSTLPTDTYTVAAFTGPKRR